MLVKQTSKWVMSQFQKLLKKKKVGNVQLVDVYNMASVWNKFRNEYLQCRMFLFHYYYFFQGE